MRFSLYISDSQRTFGMEEKKVMSNDKYFGRQHILDIFGRHFWLVLDFGLGRIWEMPESYSANGDTFDAGVWHTKGGNNDL